MQPREPQPLLEAFLVLERPRQRLIHWSSALAPLDDARAPRLRSIAAHYDPQTDQALIELRYDASTLGRERLAFVTEIALLAEIGMIQPGELTEGDRRRFLGERLTRCSIHVGGQRSVVGTLSELVRQIRDHKEPLAAAARAHRYATPPPIPAAHVLPRGDTSDPVVLVKAKGTRDDLASHAIPASTREHPTHSDLSEPGIDGPARPPRAKRRAQQGLPVRLDASERFSAPTVVVTPPSRMAPPARLQTSTTVQDELPSPEARSMPGIIYGRYLRSGRWVPVRIGALSLKGAALMAGALPRLEDHVDLALSFGTTRALVRGAVGKVSSVEEARLSGATTFSVSFELDEASRRQLTALLIAARAAKVMIKPPPPRQARRYPVEWAVHLGTSRGVMKSDALDVSRDGMFIRAPHALSVQSTVTFSAVLDDGGEPVSGRAKVIRQITDIEARACGLAPGYGLVMTEMGDVDRERWLGFLARIERRADKRVLIGASPARLAELQAGLAAAGYAVTGGTDPGALVQLASTAARPVDAALIDSEWLTPGMSTGWVESLFVARHVPCVTVRGDARRARTAVDRLLFGR